MPVIYQKPLSVDGWKTMKHLWQGRFAQMRTALGGIRDEKSAFLPDSRLVSEPLPVQKIQQQSQLPLAIRNIARKVVSFVTYASIAVSIFVFAFLAIPEIYYRLVPVEVVPLTSSESGTPIGGAFSEGSWFRKNLNKLTLNQSKTLLAGLLNPEDTSNDADNEPEPELPPKPTRYLPPKDETLPEGDWIIIPRIGVRTEFKDNVEPEEAMQSGVWKVPDYGLPGQLNMPVILAAHRFGWDWWWQSDYWRYNSFYLLPETEPGDRVEIISDQRKWVYEIYAGEEGTDITDYEADMILYTCKFLTSPLRHFRYARLIDVNANTQFLSMDGAAVQSLVE
jgi:hypothetical protein